MIMIDIFSLSDHNIYQVESEHEKPNKACNVCNVLTIMQDWRHIGRLSFGSSRTCSYFALYPSQHCECSEHLAISSFVYVNVSVTIFDRSH